MHTIIIVDDEESDRENIRRILTGKGYTIVEGDSYETAISVFEQHRYSIALLIADISLPGIDSTSKLSPHTSSNRLLARE